MVREVIGEFRGHAYRARRWRSPDAAAGGTLPGYWVVTVEPRRDEESRMIFPAQPDDTPAAVRAEIEAWLQAALG
jgi:hypothetical protein